MFAGKVQPSQAEVMLLHGIEQMTEHGKTAKLENLVKTYPGTPQATAASQILKANQKDSTKELRLELDKLRDENERLHRDLETLRQLLIKLEKRAS